MTGMDDDTAEAAMNSQVRALTGNRERLLAGVPVTERRMAVARVATAVLEGGDGPPMVLLHGPGESAAKWMRVIPGLVATHRVIAPDLPAHGASEVPDHGPLDAARVLGWLDDLIEQTCASQPELVGYALGGAVAARYAVEHSDRLRRLVLVDALGMARFRPRPGFALAMIGFQVRPTEGSYTRFMRQCAYDTEDVRRQLGERWDPYIAYAVDLAHAPGSKAVGRLMRELVMSPVPPEDLARISVPTTLIWGRHDRATRLAVAQAASDRYGWPLHIIEECADDPPRDRPEEFLAALLSGRN
jgi:pimeloyl-ACP methyl ester carboxylesterase